MAKFYTGIVIVLMFNVCVPVHKGASHSLKKNEKWRESYIIKTIL